MAFGKPCDMRDIERIASSKPAYTTGYKSFLCRAAVLSGNIEILRGVLREFKTTETEVCYEDHLDVLAHVLKTDQLEVWNLLLAKMLSGKLRHHYIEMICSRSPFDVRYLHDIKDSDLRRTLPVVISSGNVEALRYVLLKIGGLPVCEDNYDNVRLCIEYEHDLKLTVDDWAELLPVVCNEYASLVLIDKLSRISSPALEEAVRATPVGKNKVLDRFLRM